MNKLFYRPELDVSKKSKLTCPECKKKLNSDHRSVEGNKFVCSCGAIIFSCPDHHEREVLGHSSFLVGYDMVPVPAGYQRHFCPICSSIMEVVKHWFDVTGETIDARLSLALLCSNRDCNYYNVIKFIVPIETHDWNQGKLSH